MLAGTPLQEALAFTEGMEDPLLRHLRPVQSYRVAGLLVALNGGACSSTVDLVLDASLAEVVSTSLAISLLEMGGTPLVERNRALVGVGALFGMTAATPPAMRSVFVRRVRHATQ
jgi:hypothetical protein